MITGHLEHERPESKQGLRNIQGLWDLSPPNFEINIPKRGAGYPHQISRLVPIKIFEIPGALRNRKVT